MEANGEVPEFALEEEAVMLVPADDGGPPHALLRYAGPAVLRAWGALKWTFLIWLLVPMVTLLTLISAGDGSGLPKPPPWLLPAMGPGVLYLLYKEHRVRGVLLVPIARTMAAEQPLKTLGLYPAPFTAWLTVNTVISATAHTDVVTTGVFVARAVFADWTGGSVASAWTHIMHEDILTGGVVVPFSIFAVTGLMLRALQLAFALYEVLPVDGTDVKTGKPIGYGYEATPYYKTRGNPTCAHDHALPLLLDAARMASLVGPVFDTIMKKLDATPWTRSLRPRDSAGSRGGLSRSSSCLPSWSRRSSRTRR